MMHILPFATVALLAACAAHNPPSDEAAVPGTRCDANAAQALVGKPAGTGIEEAKRLSGAREVRRYRKGDALTLDFRPDRLNIETDANGTILRFICG